MALDIDYVVALVNEELPGTELYKIQAKINRFMVIYMSGGKDAVINLASGDMVSTDTYVLPANVLSIDMVYVGGTLQRLTGADAYYSNSMGSNEIYVGAYEAGEGNAIYFGRDVRTGLATAPIKILCQKYTADPATLSEAYTMCVVAFVLHSLYLEKKDELAQYYMSMFESEYNKLRPRSVAHPAMNMGTDL